MVLAAKPDIKLSADDALKPSMAAEPPVRKSRTGMKALLALVGITVGLGGLYYFFADKVLEIAGGGDGAIPTIAANTTPFKIRPENPGGMQVPNQGRLVYGVVDGSAGQPRMERLLPETEKPVDVDQVLKRPVPETNSVVAGSAPRGIADAPPVPPKSTGGAPRSLIAPSASSAMPATRPAPPAAPASAVTTQELARVPTAQDVARLKEPAPPPIPPAPGSSGAPARFVAPTAASAPTATPVKTAPTPTPVQMARAQPTPAPAAPKTDMSKVYRVQLAAARSEDAVKAEWDNMRRRNIDVLGELSLQIARADLGPTKGIFYRLRVGPLDDETAAKALCERLKQRKVGCLVVKPGS